LSTKTHNFIFKTTDALSSTIRTSNLPSPEFIELNQKTFHNFQTEDCLLLYALFIETRISFPSHWQ